MACTQGCPTKNHRNFGECLRAKHLSVVGLESTGPGISRDRERLFDRENKAFDQAVADGLDPVGVDLKSVETAYRQADSL